MNIQIRAKGLATFRPDLGYFDLQKKKLVLWLYSHRLNNKNDSLTIKDFDFPDNVKTIYLQDQDSDVVINVPVSVFKKAYKENEGYTFVYSDWAKKYRKLN